MHCLNIEAVCKSVVRLAIAISAVSAVFGSFANAQEAVKSAAVQTTWTISVDVTSGNPRPVYDVKHSPATGGCPYAEQEIVPENLLICSGDTVRWVALTTKPGGSGAVQSEMRIYFQGTPLVDGHSAPTQRFHGVDGAPTQGGQTYQHAETGQPYEYCIAVFDKAASPQLLFIDDPKIIIGTGSPIEIDRLKKKANEIEKKANQLYQSLNGDPSAKKLAGELVGEAESLQELLERR